MTGEMSRAEVTPEAYPGLFNLQRSLKRRGIESEPRPFDQYCGPYLAVPGICKVWYSESTEYSPEKPLFLIQVGPAPAWGGTFETVGAEWIEPATKDSLEHGNYTIRQASKRIAQIK